MHTKTTDHDRTNGRLAYSIDEACRLLSIGRTSLYDMAKKDEIQFLRIGGRTLVPRSEPERLTRV